MSYELLSRSKTLGIYNRCEITNIFLWKRCEKQAYNIFTIFSFGEKFFDTSSCESTVNRLLKTISKEYSIGIKQKTVELDEVDIYYRNLCSFSAGEKTVDIGFEQLHTGLLEEVPPVFVQAEDTDKEIVMNRVLKNNFRNGSYLIEFFDIEKPVIHFLSEKQLKEVCNIIYEEFPIDLLTVSDRIGNFIFQFPSLNVDVHYQTDNDEENLYYQIHIDKRVFSETKYCLSTELKDDNTITGNRLIAIESADFNPVVSVGDASNKCSTTVYDIKNQLILHRLDANLMREMTLNMRLGNGNGKQRELYDENGNIRETIDIFTNMETHIGPPKILGRKKWIQQRKYLLHMKEVITRKEFLQYGAERIDEHEKALEDIINIMQTGVNRTVYLWDPYLKAEDLLETWYHTTVAGMKIRAITSRLAADTKNGDIHSWIEKQKETLDKGSNHYGIDLEFRCQWGDRGYKFHDRFLMIVSETERPLVWSLGASINGLGSKHHIIQKVSHPQMVVDAFENLWDELQGSECLIWKRK